MRESEWRRASILAKKEKDEYLNRFFEEREAKIREVSGFELYTFAMFFGLHIPFIFKLLHKGCATSGDWRHDLKNCH